MSDTIVFIYDKMVDAFQEDFVFFSKCVKWLCWPVYDKSYSTLNHCMCTRLLQSFVSLYVYPSSAIVCFFTMQHCRAVDNTV